MNNNLRKLLEVIEPEIRNINENRVETEALRKVSETMKELVELGVSSKKIFDFYDQEFIFKAIKIGNSNADDLINKYQSSKYLLQNDNEDLCELPQFKEALSFMGELYQYLCGLNEKIVLDYETKNENLKVQEIQNKYYGLLNRNDIFIKDIEEFITFLDLNKLDIEERLDILIYINKCNIKNYITTNDIEIGKNITLSSVRKVLRDNQELINKTYNLNQTDYELNKYLKDNFSNIDDALNDRKIYLINEINSLYQNKKYFDIITYYNDFKEIKNIEKEIEKQNRCTKQLYFLFKNNKSLVRDYLEKANLKYRSCVLKNLIDLETTNTLYLPKLCYNSMYLYLKDDFVVKTVYTFLDDFIFVLGVLDKGENLEDFVNKNEYLLNEIINNKDIIEKNSDERNIILDGVRLEDLVLSIDLDTLDINMEDKNGR
ncbi:MAG: hypothetical protein IJ068_05105 [Bacilli bacterium]|nr:hypothetical protein [Bacilli bacterium]